MENRRHYSRIKVTGTKAVATVLNKQFEVEVLDQSIGGIGFRGPEMVNVVKGLSISLELDGETCEGSIQSVYYNASGELCFGMSRDEAQSEHTEEMLLNTYIQSGAEHFVCDVHSELPGDEFEVFLIADKLVVSREMIHTLPRNRRALQIQDRKFQQKLIQLYQLSPRSTQDDILDYEFCTTSPLRSVQTTWLGCGALSAS